MDASNQRETWTGQEPADQSATSEMSWGEGSASALESMKQREQRRDHSAPRRDADQQHPQADRSGEA